MFTPLTLKTRVLYKVVAHYRPVTGSERCKVRAEGALGYSGLMNKACFSSPPLAHFWQFAICDHP